MGEKRNIIITKEKMIEIVDVRFSDKGMMVDAADCYHFIPWIPKSLSHYALHSKKLGKSIVKLVEKKTGADIVGPSRTVPDNPLPKRDDFWNVSFAMMLPFPQKFLPKVKKYLTSLFSHKCHFTDDEDNSDLDLDSVSGKQNVHTHGHVSERMWIDCEDSAAIFARSI